MITTYFKNMIADHLWHTVNSGDAILPEAYYVAISTTEPKEDGTGVTEPTGDAAYIRQPLGSMTAANGGSTANATSVVWNRFDTDQGTVGYWALFDAQTGGQLLMGGALDSPKHLDAGTTIVFEPGSLVLNVLGA